MIHPENISGIPKRTRNIEKCSMMLKGAMFALSLLILLMTTAQSANASVVQPITAATPFEQMAQGQQGQPGSAPKPGTILLTTFPNGTSKAQFVNGTTVQVLNGVGYLVLDSSASVAAAATASAPVSNTVVNRIYQAIAVAISINIEQNDTLEPLPPQPNKTEPGGPDQDCLFEPSLPKCTPGPEGCPEGFGMNEDGQCFPLGGCPDGYHSNEDDETGTCYPDSEPCPDGQIRSDEGNYCVVPLPEPEECEGGEQPNPSTGECEPIACPAVISFGDGPCDEYPVPPPEGEPLPPLPTPPMQQPPSENGENMEDLDEQEQHPPEDEEDSEQQEQEQPPPSEDDDEQTDDDESDSNSDDGGSEAFEEASEE